MPWDVPYGVVIRTEVTSPEVVVLDNKNGTKCTRPVTNEREEVGQGLIEPMSAYD